MTPERFRRIASLFMRALERPPGERAALVARACGEDAALREEVESLLEAHERTGAFVVDEPLGPAAALAAAGVRAPLAPGTRLGRYEVVSRLGEGGMGEVYLARDVDLRREVALKLLRPEAARDARRRLLREARAASALNHPNIVTIHAIEEAGGVDFIVMERVAGESLRAAIDRGPLEPGRLLDVGAQVADALAAAHAVGLIHRDVKPANILLAPDGRAKVLDFGLAKALGPPEPGAASAEATGEGLIAGTLAYMSPEQTRGEPLDARSDVFSLGVVLYEAATGRPPFSGPTALSVMHEIGASDPPPPSAVRPGLPREMDLVVERSIAKERERRYASAAEMAAALRRLAASCAPAAAAAPSAADATPAPGGEAFVGREPELERLDAALRRAAEGAGGVVFLTGEAGIGKTALADAFLGRARAARPEPLVSRGRCVEQYGTGEAYLPFLDALGALLLGPGRERAEAALRTHAPTWCLQFPAAFASSGALEQLRRETIGAGKERMLREMGDALGAMAGGAAAAGAPVVLLLEDLHWADPSSVDLLRHLGQRAGAQRLLVIGTLRPEQVEAADHPLRAVLLEMRAHRQCEEVALGSLGPEHVLGHLDARFAPNDFPRELAALVHRKTEGHPLFATSLVQLLVESGEIVRAGGRWTLARSPGEMNPEIPESVRSMIRRKADALCEEDRRALQYASVVGEEFASTVVADLLGVDELALEERLDRLDRVHRLVETLGEEELPDGAVATRYRFAHVLYQNVLYGELVGRRRRLLHRRAGERLLGHYGDRAPRIASQLALHFERGRDFGRAVEHLVRAGDNAAGIYAHAEAREHYTHALGLLERLAPEERAERRLALHERRGTVNVALSRFDEAVGDFERALEGAREAGAPERECSALRAITGTLFHQHRLEEMGEYARRALAAAERAGSEVLRAETLAQIALRHIGLGELAEAREFSEQAIRTGRALGHKPALAAGLTYRGTAHFFQSEYEPAERALGEGRALAVELRDGFTLLWNEFFLGLTLGNLGRMSDALETLEGALATVRRNGNHMIHARLPNSIAWIYRELGDVGRATELDREGLEIARAHRMVEAEANSLINLGYDYTHARDAEATRAAFRGVEAIFERDIWNRWRFYDIRLQAAAAEHHLAAGDLDEAERCARRALENAARHGVPKYMAVARKVLGEAAAARGDAAGGEAQLEGALAALGGRPAPLVVWKVYAALGRARAGAGERAGAGAREAYERAAAVVREIASNVRDERLRATFLGSPAVREVLDAASARPRHQCRPR